ncbi:glycosyltransferase family 9 protein [Hippea sp. KM1]|uniref:glycosyltransferase family 9 protein n=1 Tax=Hippea sp. KM1 TaxID=944481 RepID=UPI00046D0799|nr:glycosyltransferase family 9 protein [Hippea sp. KM1]
MKILIIQLKQLGDVLLSTPIAEAIKSFNNTWRVDFLTSKAARPIIEDNPFIDNILTIKDGVVGEIETILKVRGMHYDAVLDLQRTGRSKRISLFSKAPIRSAFYKEGDNIYYNKPIKSTVEGYTAFERLEILKALGIENPKRAMPRLFFDESVEDRVKEYLMNHNISSYFVVAPTARKPTKMWKPERFGLLSDRISNLLGLKTVVVYGADDERQIAYECASKINNVHLIEKPFDIKGFAALVKNAAFLIGNDSFASHVAVSQSIKTIVICGPTSGWFIENNNTLLVYRGLSCQPCNNPSKCRLNFACYGELSVDFAFERIKGFLFK